MSDNGGGKAPQRSDELQLALEELRDKNAELQGVVNYIQNENSSYKKKYHFLKNKLLNVTNLLEKNAKAFNHLFDDAKCALQLSRVSINSPVPPRKSILPKNSGKGGPSTAVKSIASRKLSIEHVNIEDLASDTPKAGPSGVVAATPSSHNKGITVQKLQIEPLNMEELTLMEDENEDEYTLQTSREEVDSPPSKLSVIPEENSGSGRPTELYVKLEKLPSHLMDSYLQKSAFSNNSSVNNDSILIERDPYFASTPMKLNLMAQLGLMESPGVLNNSNNRHRFISHRRKQTGSGTTSATSQPGSSSGLVCPKKEKKSLPNNSDGSFNISSHRKNSNPSKENLLSPKKEKKVRTSKREKSFTKNKEKQSDTPAAKNKRTRSAAEASPVLRHNLRPVRRARPTNLKEETLKAKKRRN